MADGRPSIPLRLLSLRDTYDHSRRHVGLGVLRSIYRAIRWELIGRYYPS